MPSVYLSGPMTGYPEYNFPAFHDAEARLGLMGYDVFNPARSFNGDTGRPYQDYVVEDIRLLQRADAIYLLPGWNGPGARGSVWEWGIATQIFRRPVLNQD